MTEPSTNATDELAGETPAASSLLRLNYRIGEIGIGRVSLPGVDLPPGSLKDGSAARRARAALASSGRVAIVRSVAIGQPLERIRIDQGLIRYVPVQYRRFYIPLGPGTFDDYLRGFSSRTRATLRRKLRKCVEASAGSLVCAESRSRIEIAGFLEAASTVSRLTYQERLLGKGLPTDATFREEMLQLADEDRVRAYLLRFGERLAAYLICPVRDRRVIYQCLGYDPRLAPLSPGTVLQYLALERLFAERRDWVFDFTEGEGEHKAFWARDSELCADVCYLSTGPRSVLLVGSHLALTSTMRLAARILDRLGMKAPLKRWVRSRAWA